MRKFDFNLQRLLDYKRTVEDVLLAELAGIRAEHVRERAKLMEMVSAKESFGARIKKTLVSGDPEQIKRAYGYLQDLTSQIAAQDVRVRQIAERRDKKMAEVIEASKERKALERLRERKEEEHRLEAQRMAQDFLDDVGSIKNRRQSCGVGEAA